MPGYVPEDYLTLLARIEQLEANQAANQVVSASILQNYDERAAKVLKRELPGQAAGVALPARDLASKPGDLRLWERRRPRRVLLAVLVDKLRNGRTVLVKGPNRLGTQPSSMRLPGGLRMPTANPRGFLRRLIAATRTGLRVPVGVRQH